MSMTKRWLDDLIGEAEGGDEDMQMSLSSMGLWASPEERELREREAFAAWQQEEEAGRAFGNSEPTADNEYWQEVFASFEGEEIEEPW